MEEKQICSAIDRDAIGQSPCCSSMNIFQWVYYQYIAYRRFDLEIHHTMTDAFGVEFANEHGSVA